MNNVDITQVIYTYNNILFYISGYYLGMKKNNSEDW